MTDLTEMWTELEKYQPYAEKHGFGEAWNRMCKERTCEASCETYAAACWSANGKVLRAIDAVGLASTPTAAQNSSLADVLERYVLELILEAIEQEDKT